VYGIVNFWQFAFGKDKIYDRSDNTLNEPYTFDCHTVSLSHDVVLLVGQGIDLT